MILDTAHAIGWKANDFALQGIDGKTYSFANIRGPKGTLVAFICNHCPYVKASISRIVADADALRQIGIGTIAIMPNDSEVYPEDSFDNMKAFAARHGFTFPYVIDTTQEVARAARNARRDLFEAMKQIVETGHGPKEQFPSLGCSIKWKR
jgi:peroxiredoxin